MFACRHAPWLLHIVTSSLAPLARRDSPALVSLLPVPHARTDENILGRMDVRVALRAAIAEAFRQGGAAFAQDLILFAERWPFDLSEITVPVHIWHGEADTIIPAAWARALSVALPDSSLHAVADAGHLWVTDNVEHVVMAVARIACERTNQPLD